MTDKKKQPNNGLIEYRRRTKLHKRASIMKAAQDTLPKTGIHNMNIAELARLADVSTATVYKHFDSKTEIIEACVNDLSPEERSRFLMRMAAASLAALGDDKAASNGFKKLIAKTQNEIVAAAG